MLGILFAISMIANNKYKIKEYDDDDNAKYIGENFPKLMELLGIKKSSIKKEMNKFLNAIKNKNFLAYETEQTARNDKFSYVDQSSKDLLKKLTENSAKQVPTSSASRIRDASLVNLLKSYYIKQEGNETVKCECCHEKTFMTDSGSPYLEFHHIIPFNLAAGPDHFLNLVGLCPNCHRKIHFIEISKKKDCYENLNCNNYLKKSLLVRLAELKKCNLLKSYHLEYLYADNALSDKEYEQLSQ